MGSPEITQMCPCSPSGIPRDRHEHPVPAIVHLNLGHYVTVTAHCALGAGQVASVDGPLTDDTITYTYD